MNDNMNDESGSSVSLLGDYLKQKRLDKNFSLEKLSQKTKISVNILKSLEANDYEHLPSAAYIKGFVTSYVKVLGLPLHEAINKMEYTYLNILGKPFPALNHTKQMAMAPKTSTPNESAPEAQTPHEVIKGSDSIMKNTKSFLPIIVFAIVILVFIGGYKLISSVIENEVNSQKPKDMGPTFESSSALVNNPTKVEQPKIEATPAPIATPTPATSPVAATEVKKPEEVKVEPEVSRNFPLVKFNKIRSATFEVIENAPENSDETILPANIKESMNSELQNVYVRAVSGNTWLSYKISEKPITSQIINQGSDLLIQGKEIRLFLGNVNVTKIFYNNHLIATPTKNGVKSLIFPATSTEKFVVPLFPKGKDDIQYTAEEYQKRMKIEEEELAKKNAQ